MEGSGCGCGPFIEGAGADVAQSARARARSATVQPPIPGGRTIPGANFARNDFSALQMFPRRPSITESVNAANAGVSPASTLSLPGRQPPPGWDGENDAWSPHAESVVS